MNEIMTKRYILEHRFLPSAFLNNPSHVFNKINAKKESLFYDLYEAFEIDCKKDDFKIEVMENNNMFAYVVKIPQPKECSITYDCECSRIVFYKCKNTSLARYLTLEYDLFVSKLKNEPLFMLCEWTKLSHNNYGNIIGLDDTIQMNLIKKFLKY